MRAVWVFLLVFSAGAQEKRVPREMPVPRPRAGVGEVREVPDPVSPAAQVVEDARVHMEFQLPAGWNLSRRDGEVSTFRLDARTAPRRTELRAVASLAFNPYPLSNFAGALLYLSVLPKSTEAACVAQTTARPEHALEPQVLGDVRFSRGKDEHGRICTEARDVTYTALHGGSCVRFDLVINTFCGKEVSGAEDLTEAQLGALFKRMEGVLDTVKFTGR